MTTMHLCGGSLLIEDAEALVGDYLNPSYGYAWPAYDTLVTNGSASLVTGDLLAPTLLEVHMDAARFGALYDMRTILADVANLPACGLAEASDDDVRAVAALFRGLDEHRKHVRGTIVSKVLHRKRPDLVPLYDSHIDHGYRASGRLPYERQGTWVEYMCDLYRLMRDDLQREADAFAALRTFASSERGADLTTLRILDILVWMTVRDHTA